MALVYIYSDETGSTIDITDRCRLYQLSVKDQAEEGAVAISTLTVDDPDGDIEFTGHRRLYIYEDTAPVGNQIIYNGFISNARVIRGPSGRTGASRQWVLDLADVNVLINRRIMNGPDAIRPAETDTERILALFGMTELNTVDDDSLVSLTATTVDMDAVPDPGYKGQNVGAYIDDCRQASGKNAYIYYNETLGEYGLWYDFAESIAYDSGCRLTNTIGESNGTDTFNYSLDRTYLNRDPSRVASGIYLEYDGGLVYQQSPVTITNFAAIDWASPSVNVKTAAKATARANRYLFDAGSEHEIVHVVMTDVPRASVNAIKKGQLVSFKSSYMTGYEDYRVCRVLYRQVTEIAEDPESSFEIEMDLDPTVPTIEVTGLWANFQWLTQFGLGGSVTDSAPGFIDPVGGATAIPGDGMAALFVMLWTGQGVAGSGQVPNAPAVLIEEGINTWPSFPGGYKAGIAERIVDPTSGDYSMGGTTGQLGSDTVASLACFLTPAGSPYSRVQSSIANGTVTLSSPATVGNLLVLGIVVGATHSYFPGYVDTDSPDVPDQTGWTAAAPTAKMTSPHLDLDGWPALRMFYKIAAGGETSIPIDPGLWPFSTGIVVEYAP